MDASHFQASVVPYATLQQPVWIKLKNWNSKWFNFNMRTYSFHDTNFMHHAAFMIAFLEDNHKLILDTLVFITERFLSPYFISILVIWLTVPFSEMNSNWKTHLIKTAIVANPTITIKSDLRQQEVTLLSVDWHVVV